MSATLSLHNVKAISGGPAAFLCQHPGESPTYARTLIVRYEDNSELRIDLFTQNISNLIIKKTT